MIPALLPLLVLLTFTHPESTAYWRGAGDSLDVFCERPDTGEVLRSRISDLWDSRLYAYSLAGGGWLWADAHDARGLEGLPGSYDVDPGPGAWYAVTTRRRISPDSLVESCFSNEVYVPGSAVSGVAGADVDPIVSLRTYSVLGREVREPRSSGIYFERTVRRSGRIERLTVLYLRGERIPLTRVTR